MLHVYTYSFHEMYLISGRSRYFSLYLLSLNRLTICFDSASLDVWLMVMNDEIRQDLFNPPICKIL